jgi:signal transduction histidine kinase
MGSLRSLFVGPPGLRRRTVLGFAAGSLIVVVVLSSAAYLIARGYLIAQRERVALQQAYTDASFVRGALLGGADPAEVLADVSPPPGTTILLEVDGAWTPSSSLGFTQADVPPSLVLSVAEGQVAYAWTEVGSEPVVAVGVPLPATGAAFFELSSSRQLETTLLTLRRTLLGASLAAALIGAGLGLLAARRVLQPLDVTAAVAARIAAGDLATRLPDTEDPDLATLVASFNSMVDSLAARIDREARLTADVAHELRSPLTTLVAGVGLLQARRDELPERSRRALDLVAGEATRFQHLLEDLLQLARIDAGSADMPRERVDAAALVREALRSAGRPDDVLLAPDGAVAVLVAKRDIERCLENLFVNADLHGGGLARVGVAADDGSVLVAVDDHGPGVPENERERIFERFARGEQARGGTGTGLGLSIVAQTVRAHGGDVWCTDAPDGGARFVLRLPQAPAPAPGDEAARRLVGTGGAA